MTNWLLLYVAIALEVAGTTSIKLSRGLTVLGPSVLSLVLYSASLGALSIAMNRLQMGIAYAIWSGLGTLAVAAIGIGYFNEPLNSIKVVSLCLVILGVVGLNLSGGHQH
jgi:small multidrug resistance pump